jgi:AraC-like DNA-binding protein
MTEWLHQISPCIRDVGSARYTSGWIEPQRFIHDHQLVLFAKGDFDVEFPLQTFDCPEQSFLIVPPGVYHVTRMHSRTGQRCWVHFDWNYHHDETLRPLISYPPEHPDPKELCPTPPFVPEMILHGRSPQSAVLELHKQINSLWNTGQLREQLLSRGILLQLLVELLGPEVSETAQSLYRTNRLPQKIRLRLDRLAKRTIDNMPSIQKELESFGCSYAHACRVFHFAYGLSPLAYTHRLRMERAKLLLRKGKLSIARVGLAVGIHNPAYFSRLFRNIVGLSPRQYAVKQKQIG